MRKILLLLLISMVNQLDAQRNYTPTEISRLADLGKIWGMLHNFHPNMTRGIISPDSLVADIAESLSKDPSAANFKTSLEKMLIRLNDPITRVVIKNELPVKLFTDNSKLPLNRLLTDSVLYIVFPTTMAYDDTVKKLNWLQPQQLRAYKGLVFDLRNKEENDADYSFMEKIGTRLLENLSNKSLQMPVGYYRYQVGFPDQNSRLFDNNIYSAGWQTRATDPLWTGKGPKEWKTNLVFVINRFTSAALLNYLHALQFAGYCKIVFDGEAKEYAGDAAINYITDADSLEIKIRVLDYISADGKKSYSPDWMLNDITDENAFLEKCRSLALSPNIENRPAPPLFNYQHPFPRDTFRAMAPVGYRLFGLYNYWNALEYFNPNKHLLKGSWDSVLTEFIPRFINAADTAAYFHTILALVSRIHDSHGFFAELPPMQSVMEAHRYTLPVTVKYIGNKFYVVATGKDSTQDLGVLQVWDELTAIDNTPIHTYKEKFRSRFAYSNEWTFHRDVSNMIFRGAKNSAVELTLLRHGKIIKQQLNRSVNSYQADLKLVAFNDDHKDIELLPGNIGYVNMGLLSRNRVGRLFDTLMQTKAIIFDIRNYPQGTAWSIVPRLTDHDSLAVKFGYPLVSFESIYAQPQMIKRDGFFTVNADKTAPFYKGKIVMLCNAQTQSQAEYTIMMFQGAAGKRVTVIGSPTAGADGNVTAVYLPGGYKTYFSGLEVLYPDGAQTQQNGIRIDIKAEATLEGLKAGKDEVLQRAIQFATSGK